MKVIYVAAYYVRHYVRQDVVRRTLTEIPGVEVIECIYNKKGIWRYILILWKFMWMSKRDIDVVIVGFRGHELLPFVKLMTRKPIVFDAFLSLYDTLCFDRKTLSPRLPLGRLMYWFDRFNCHVANQVLLDTQEHIRYFHQTFGIAPEKCSCVYIGADDRLFYPIHHGSSRDHLEVFYYGTTLPLQGIDIILRAIKLLESTPDIHFRLVGPIRKRYGQLIDQLQLRNVEFIPWVPYDQLPQEISRSDVCLAGHFSGVEKAKRVIPGKAYQFVAMAKPIILGNNPANREVFADGYDCLMVEMDNPELLAQGVYRLYRDRRFCEAIAKQGRRTYESVQKLIVTQLQKVMTVYVRT